MMFQTIVQTIKQWTEISNIKNMGLFQDCHQRSCFVFSKLWQDLVTSWAELAKVTTKIGNLE